MKHWIINYPTPKVSPITRPVCLSRGGWTSQEPGPLTEQEMRLLEEAFTGLGTILELLERSSTGGGTVPRRSSAMHVLEAAEQIRERAYQQEFGHWHA